MEGATYRAFTYCRPRLRLLVAQDPASRAKVRDANHSVSITIEAPDCLDNWQNYQWMPIHPLVNLAQTSRFSV
jgi:hypothetical protein